MQKQDKINIIYGLIGEGKELTTKELINKGLSNVDLTRFTKEKILIRTEKGKYQLNKNMLLEIANKLIENNQTDEAMNYLEGYYKLDKTNHIVLINLLNNAVIEEDYEKIFTLINDIYDKDEQTSNTDFNFYLVLLKKIVELPIKFKEKAKYIVYYDIEIKDRKTNNIEELNKLRSFVINNKITSAKQIITKLINENNTIEYQLINNLIDNIIKKRNPNVIKIAETSTNYSVINKYLNNKEYDALIDYFNNDKEKLNKNMRYILNVCETLISITKTSRVPLVIESKVQNVYDAIDNNNFKLALSISAGYNKAKNIDNSNSSMYLILKDINNLINSLKINESITVSDKGKENIIEMKQESKVESEPLKQTKQIAYNKKDETQSTPEENNVVSSIIDIITSLLKEDLENAFKSLKSYLKIVNKEKYEFLVIDLIKLSILEKDKAYTKPMAVLNYLSRENYTFEISEYIESFYKTLTENNFDETRIYLDILKHAYELGQNCFLINELEKILINTEKIAKKSSGSTLKLRA